MAGKRHRCRPCISCPCSTTALEPSEDCYIHGFGSHPFRCACGRFVTNKAGARALRRLTRQLHPAMAPGRPEEKKP